MGLPDLKISIYADGASKETILKRYREGAVKGFTTNPTLMAKAGIRDYKAFAREILSEVKDLPISFEVFADDAPEMLRQGLEIATWGKNVNVKIPITNTKGESTLSLIQKLAEANVKLNVTAIFTDAQVSDLAKVVRPKDDVIVSIFAGRIADTGVDPIAVMTKAVKIFADKPGSKILWASPREVLNIYQANDCGCHIITVTDDLISKLKLYKKPLVDYSLETVKMFYQDAQAAGFQL